MLKLKPTSKQISTHALTWSATSVKNVPMPRLVISTHALTWSATGFEPPMLHQYKISTHALTWSATTVNCDNSFLHVYFNSRTHVECDGWDLILTGRNSISTHALTWSATLTLSNALSD